MTLIGAGADEDPGVGTVYAPVSAGGQASNHVINITATDVTIQNIFVDGFKNLDSNTGQSYARIFMSTADRTTIEDVVFQNYVTGGIELNGSNDSVIRNVTTFGVDADGAYTPLDIGFGTSQDGIRIVDAEGVTIEDFSADTVEYGIVAFQGPTSFSVDNVSITNAEFGIAALTQSFNYGGGAFVRFGGQQDVTIDGAVNLTNVNIGFRLVDLTNDDSGTTDTVTGLPGGPGNAPDINLILTGNESFSLNNVTIPVQRQGEGSVPNLANFVDAIGLDAVSTDFDTSGLPQGEWYFVDPLDAVAKVAAEAVNPLSAVVQEISSTDYYVGPGMSIQPAIDDAVGGESVRILTGTYAGNVDAGSKAVTLHPGTSPGQVVINGDLILNGDDALDIEINGTTAGSGFDQIVVNGDVNLNGADLNLIDGFDPADGDRFTLIQNNGVNPVSGIFSGYLEGHEFANFLGSGLNAYLTYVGGNGNDVVIHMVDSTPEITVPNNGTADQYTLEIVGGNFVLSETISGTIISTFPVAAVNGPLVIIGEDGEDDTLTIDLDNIDHTTDIQIEFRGGTGGNDTLILERTGAINSVEHVFTNASDGSIFLDGEATATITYTGLEPIDDQISATNRTFSYLGGAETITLSDFGGANDDVSVISSTLGEAVNFNHNSLTSITIITTDGSGADTVNINSVDGNFSSNLTVTAGTDDMINTGTVDIGSGALDLTGGQVNVNGAFTTTGSVDIDSTFGNIHFAAAGSIDAGTSEIDLTAASNVNSLNVTTTSEVRVTATLGGINDLTGNAQITADRVALRAGTGGITGIATTVNTLAASATDGGFDIDNTGDLEIGSVDSLDGITANSSTIFVTATGALTVNQAVSAETIGYLRAVDAVSAGQDINVNAGITTTSGDLNLQAGDNLNLATGVTLNSAAAMIISIDSPLGGTPDAAGGVANLNGILLAGTNITVNGGTQADQVIIDSNGGTASDGGTVDGIQDPFTFNSNGGADQLILDDSGDSSGDVISISSTGPGLGAVAGAGLAALGFNFSSPSTITLNTGTDTDVISVELGNGSPDVNITSAGGADSLTVLGRASGDDLLVATPGAVGTGSGTILDLGFPKTINFDGITGPILIDGRGSATTDLVTIL
ncbi:MAG TPA: hypothetical protein DCY03_25535, partial [Planctomycetaceae bacterium]|nr:hypothetical protein [Planctomycetaceae bacterium]